MYSNVYLQVQDITSKILESEFEHGRLESENAQLQAALNAKVWDTSVAF